MYWSEWGHANCIKKSFMDGTSQQTLILNTRTATGLTLDYEKKRLYWAEVTTPAIVSADLNGLDKIVLAKDDLKKPASLTFYQDFLYWSDDRQILRVNKTNGESRSTVHFLSESATDLLVFHASRQKGFNQCAVNNGGCSNLCLAQPTQNGNEPAGYACACPTHYTAQNNTCIRKCLIVLFV